MLHFSFYLILPIIPFYMMEQFGADNALIGIVLSCFTLTALLVRPFSGFFLDLAARKPQYLLAYLGITGVYLGYMFAATIGFLIMVRLAHGLFLGTATTAGGTLVIDIMPSERRGEGLGYFGMMNNLAMATGPMVGMFLHNTHPSNYTIIFGVSVVSCAIGWVVAMFIKAPPKPTVVKTPLSLDRFILLKGLWGSASLLLTAIPYAMVTSFVAVYASQLHIEGSSALFFVFFAAGLIASRLFAGKKIDRGQLTKMIAIGTFGTSVAFLLLGITAHLPVSGLLVSVYFYLTAVLTGMSYGMIFPAYNTFFVNLAHNNQRGTASSTYMTSWDLGIGIGLLLGGQMSNIIGLSHVYMIGAVVCLLSFGIFTAFTAPYYHRHKLRG
ncbi:MFS transporter [Bacteroidia bacterium]|nr:MFS transporter [Bacteroidia bacterium]